MRGLLGISSIFLASCVSDSAHEWTSPRSLADSMITSYAEREHADTRVPPEPSILETDFVSSDVDPDAPFKDLVKQADIEGIVARTERAVSYTHLTLPTIYSV